MNEDIVSVADIVKISTNFWWFIMAISNFRLGITGMSMLSTMFGGGNTRISICIANVSYTSDKSLFSFSHC